MKYISLNKNIRLAWHLALHNLNARYKASLLGFAWSFTHPFILFITYYVAFKYILRTSLSNSDIIEFAFSIFYWHWVAQSLSEASGILLNNKHLIAKVPININVIIGSQVLTQTIHFLITFLVLLVLTLPTTFELPNIFFILLAIILTSILLYSAYMTFGILNVFFRDIQHLVSNSITPLFFFTPIVYDFYQISPELRNLLFINPLSSFALIFRSAFNETSNYLIIFVSVLWLLISNFIAISCYKKFKKQLLDTI